MDVSVSNNQQVKNFKKYQEKQYHMEITHLINSRSYILHHAFIIINKGNYRLVAVRNESRIVDMEYKTLTGAKIAFGSMFKKKSAIKKTKPKWSHFYPPEKKWIEEKLNYPLIPSPQKPGSYPQLMDTNNLNSHQTSVPRI